MGDNFGLNDSYEYFEFALDSLDATGTFQSGTASTDWPLFEVAGKGPLQDVVAIKVLEAQIPFSWYVFNDVNNSFSVMEEAGPLNTVRIPIGNYTASSLAEVLTTLLNEIYGAGRYDVTYSTVKSKFTFSQVMNTPRPFEFTFGAGFGIPGVQPNSGNRNPRLWLGFPPGKTIATLVGAIWVIESPNADLVSGPNYLYLNSSKLGSDIDVFLPAGAFNLGGGKAGVQIAKIPIQCNPGGIVLWQDPDPQKWFRYDQLQTLNTFDFYLTLGNTTSETPLKLNGLGFSLKLGILKLQKNQLDRVTPTMQNGRVSRREGPKRIRPTF